MFNKNKLFENLSYDWSKDSIRLFSTPSPQTRNSFLYVQETGYFETTPSYFAERANLHSYLVLFTLSGHGCLSYLDKSYDLCQNKAFLIDCKNLHRYYCADDDGWVFLWLHFHGINAPAYYQQFASNNFPVVTLSRDSPVNAWLMRIIGLTKHPDLHSELICGNLITNVLTELITQQTKKGTVLPPTPKYIKDAIRFVDTHFQDKIALTDIATFSNISKYYLSREFSKYMGQSISDYIINKRINYAKELLLYSEYSISEIAYLCGISHITHFINLFKRKEGMTPLNYRK